jgi:hypothetical protein
MFQKTGLGSALVLVTTICAMSSVSPARADWSLSLPPPIQTAASYAAQNISSEIAAETGRKDREQGKGPSNVLPAPYKSNDRLKFPVSQPQRVAHIKSYTAGVTRSDTGKPLVYNSNVIEQTEKYTMANLSMKSNDLVDAFSYYILINFYADKGTDVSELMDAKTGIYTPTVTGQAKGLVRQLRPKMERDPNFLKFTADQRQEFADILILRAFETTMRLINAKKENRAWIDRVKAGAGKDLSQIGFNPEDIALTENGIVFLKNKKR